MLPKKVPPKACVVPAGRFKDITGTSRVAVAKYPDEWRKDKMVTIVNAGTKKAGDL
jgi:hypothetical protein